MEKIALEAIHLIYEAAMDPARWPDALDRVTAFYNGGKGAIVVHDPETRSGDFPSSARWESDWTAAYNTYYGTLNPWLANVRRRPVGLVVPAEYMLDRATLLKTEFFNDFLRPQNLLSGVGVTLLQDDKRFISATVLFPESSSHDEARNTKFLQLLSPHLKRALQINRQLATAKFRWNTAEESLNALSVGVAIVSSCGTIRFANTVAIEMLDSSEGLSIGRGGEMKASSHDLSLRLQRLIHEAACADGFDQGRAVLMIDQSPPKLPYAVLVAPLKPPIPLFGHSDRLAIVFIRDTNRSLNAPIQPIASSYGLTRAEQRLLERLLCCEDVTEAARFLGISVLTGRTHLKNILSKMGCTRQAEAIHTAASHPAWFLSRVDNRGR